MQSAAYYRKQAEMMRKLARATADRDEAFVHCMRAIEFDYMAEQAEAGGQVQQHGMNPPPPAPANQPVQHQQQPQHKGDTE